MSAHLARHFCCKHVTECMLSHPVWKHHIGCVGQDRSLTTTFQEPMTFWRKFSVHGPCWPLPRASHAARMLGVCATCCCRLQELPESLGRLKSLKILAADQNRISKVAPAIFRGCMSLQTLALHENPITIEELQSTDGYDLLEARRRKKFDKQIRTGALVGTMDEGISRTVR